MTIGVKCYSAAARSDPRAELEAARRRYPHLMLQGFRWSKRPNELLFRMIAEQTLQAGKTGNLLANKPEIDFILRLAATTQISEAIAKMGTRKGEPFLVVVAGETKAARALAGGAGWKTLKKYDLSKEELDMVENAALQNARRG